MQVVQKLKSMNCEKPVMILSAEVQNTIRNEMLALGVSCFVRKPPPPEEFRGLIEDCLTCSQPGGGLDSDE